MEYVKQCGLDDNQKDYFYNSLISVTNKFVEKKVAIIPGDYDYVIILESKTKKKKRFRRFEQPYT